MRGKLQKILISLVFFLLIFSSWQTVFAQEPPEINCDNGINGYLKSPSGVAYQGNGTIRIIKDNTSSSYDVNVHFGSDGYFNIFRTDSLWSAEKGKFKLIISISEGTREFSVTQCTGQTYTHTGLQEGPLCGSYCTSNDNCQNALNGCICCAISPGESAGGCADPAITQMGPCGGITPPAQQPPQTSTPIQPKFCTKGLGIPGNPLYEDTNCISTAIGDIPTDPQKLVAKLFPWLIGLAGGVAFILMLFGAFEIMTSSGNPEKLKSGQERLTSAIIGLMLIIFATFILRIIGLPIMEISK